MKARILLITVVLISATFIFSIQPASATGSDTHYAVPLDAFCSNTWQDANCWAHTSGGTGGAGVPTTNNIVVFDSNSGSGTFFLAGAGVAYGTSSIGYTGTFSLQTNTLTLSSIIQWQGGTMTIGASSGAGLNSVGQLLIAGGTITCIGACKITASNIILSSGGVLTASNGIITVNGNWDSSAGTVTPGTSTVVFAASGTITPGSGHFNNLTINAGVTSTLLAGPGNVNAVVLGASASLSGPTHVVQIITTFTRGAGALSDFDLSWCGAGASFPSGTFNAVYVACATPSTLTGNLTLTGQYDGNSGSGGMKIASGITLNLGGFNLDLTSTSTGLLFRADSPASTSVLIAGASTVSTTDVNIVGTNDYITSTAAGSWTVSGAWTDASTSASWSFAAPITFTSATGGTMTFAGTNLPVPEFKNVTFTSSAGTAQTFTMATRGLRWIGTLTIVDSSSTTRLDNAGLTMTGGSLTIGSGGILRTGNLTITAGYTFTMSGGSTLNVTAGKTVILSSDTRWNGAVGSYVTLRSATPGSQWYLNSAVTVFYTYVNVAGSYATNVPFEECFTSIDSGDNTNWNFASGTACQMGNTIVNNAISYAYIGIFIGVFLIFICFALKIRSYRSKRGGI